MKNLKFIVFLKDVFLFSISAFGGPQGHLGMMIKTFVDKRKYLTKNELINFNIFCQLLPGATSTQTLLLIGYKRGGIFLAILTLIVWVLPASFIMGFLALFVIDVNTTSIWFGIFKYIQPMAIGFLVFSTIESIFSTIKSKLAFSIFFISFILSIIYFNGPWIFPVVLFIGATLSRIFTKIEPNPTKFNKLLIKWIYVRLFFIFFTIIAISSELSRKFNWQGRKEFNLVEHFYRFGSIVYGGGDVLIPIMYEQFVLRPNSSHVKINNRNVLQIDRNDFLTGSGLVRAIPGPVFSIASYMGIMTFKKESLGLQLFAGFSAIIALFLPGLLLVLFLYPVFNNLQQYKSVMQAIEGIQAAVVGLLLTSTLYLLKEIILIPVTTARLGYISFGIILLTFLLLKFTKINPQYIVAFFLLMGLLL